MSARRDTVLPAAVLVVVALPAVGCGRDAPRDASPTPAASEATTDTGAGVRIRPLRLTPPSSGTVLGFAEVVVENVSGASIPSGRVDAEWVQVSGTPSITVLRSPCGDWDDRALSPGEWRRCRVLVLRRGDGDQPAAVCGRAVARDDAGRAVAIATAPAPLAAAEWPIPEPLRPSDLASARDGARLPHVLFEYGGSVFSGLNLIEIAEDGQASAYVSKWGTGGRGAAGRHARRLDAAERAELLQALAAAPLDAWRSADPKRPPPSDIMRASLLVACGPRAALVAGDWGEFESNGLGALREQLVELTRRVADR